MVKQQPYRGSKKPDTAKNLLYNDGDYNDDIDRIVGVDKPRGRFISSDFDNSNSSTFGDFTFEFAQGDKKDAFSYYLVDKRGNRSKTVRVDLETDKSSPPPPKRTLRVRLTARPSRGKQFKRWLWDCSGTSTTTTVVMDSDKRCLVEFR